MRPDNFFFDVFPRQFCVSNGGVDEEWIGVITAVRADDIQKRHSVSLDCVKDLSGNQLVVVVAGRAQIHIDVFWHGVEHISRFIEQVLCIFAFRANAEFRATFRKRNEIVQARAETDHVEFGHDHRQPLQSVISRNIDALYDLSIKKCDVVMRKKK